MPEIDINATESSADFSSELNRRKRIKTEGEFKIEEDVDTIRKHANPTPEARKPNARLNKALYVEVGDVAQPLHALKKARDYIKELQGGESWTQCAKTEPNLLLTLYGALEEVIRLRELMLKVPKRKTLKEADPKIGAAVEKHTDGAN